MKTDWKMTNEEYYADSVHSILNNVVKDLTDDATKRFIWVETAFLKLWWNDASNYQKMQLKKLVVKEQLEIISGGIVMNDEACVTLNDVVDQMTDGHWWLQDTLGVLPSKSWQIDPFGHSSLSSLVWKGLDFDYSIDNRIPFREKAAMSSEKGLQFVWRNQVSHVLDHHYSSPLTFRWETMPNDSPIITNDNIASRAADLVYDMRNRSMEFIAPKLLVPFGDDFTFKNSTLEWDNMGKLVNYINTHYPDVTVKYATISEYVESLPPTTYPTRGQADFFTYEDTPHHCWSGFYTSWPLLKSVARSRSSLLRSADILAAVSNVPLTSAFDDLRWAVDLIQHHDGITGTSPDHTRAKYLDRLIQGTLTAEPQIERLLSVWTGVDSLSLHDLQPARTIVAFNNLAWARDDEWVEMHGMPDVDVMFNGQCQHTYRHNQSLWVSFSSLPPLGYSTYTVNPQGQCAVHTLTPTQESVLDNGYVRAVFNRTTGRLVSLQGVAIHQSFYAYDALVHENELDNVYVFRTNRTATEVNTGAYKLDIERSDDGKMFVVKQYVTPFILQEFLIMPNTTQIKIHMLIGPCPINTEIVSRFDTDLQTTSLYTDELGYESHERVFNSSRSIECSYYPVQSSMVMEDEQHRITLLTTHARGAASLKRGSFEVMLVRNSIVPGKIWNNDTSITHQHMTMFVEPISTPVHRIKSALINENNITMAASTLEYPSRSQSFILSPLPDTVHLMSYKKRSDDETIIRLVHIGDSDAILTMCVYWLPPFQVMTPMTLSSTKELASTPSKLTCVTDLAPMDIRTFSARRLMPTPTPIPTPPSNSETIIVAVVLSCLGIVAGGILWRNRWRFRRRDQPFEQL